MAEEKIRFFWEYMRDRQDGKLNRLHSRPLKMNEVERYIKKDWLQADLLFQVGYGTIYKIGHITLSGDFMTYDVKRQKFINISLNKIEEFIKKNKDEILRRQIALV